jgi:coenzyme F420-0:L-glutamate ligase/coenzyme F420-1:gamma-L-glutamate ligase
VIAARALPGIPEVREGDDLAALLAAGRARLGDGDAGGVAPREVLVVAHKVVSKAEGRVVALDDVEPSPRALELAARLGKDDPRHVEVVLRETAEVVRAEHGVLISRTHHGFVCANAGVDASNAARVGELILLPVDPDASARAVRDRIAELTGIDVGVIVTDSFGRPFRQGTTDVAIGVAGVPAILDLRGTTDRIGYELRSSRVAVADEIAGAADLARGKAEGVPAVVVRGLRLEGDGSAQEIVIERELDLFS